MEIGVFLANDQKTKAFEKLIKTRWTDDFIEDFQGEHISDHKDSADFKIYIAYNEDVILGGLIIGDRNILNNFKDPIKTARKFELQEKGYKNLTYVIVDSDFRNQGIASKLLNYAREKNNLLWLTCIDELVPLYKKNQFILHMKRIDGEKVNLMIYSK